MLLLTNPAGRTNAAMNDDDRRIVWRLLGVANNLALEANEMDEVGRSRKRSVEYARLVIHMRRIAEDLDALAISFSGLFSRGSRNNTRRNVRKAAK
jgi:hypothetical protein